MSPLKWRLIGASLFTVTSVLGCSAPQPEPVDTEEHGEAIARTEFTDRIENFFEYDPLVAGQPSQFLIHLTDLETGAPVAAAEVGLRVTRAGSSAELVSTEALVGRVTGIYVAELAVPEPGPVDIRFDVRAGNIDETMPLTGFEVHAE